MVSSSLHLRIILIFLLLLCAGLTYAGGGPQQVLIVMNANSRDSMEVGNAYRRARAIPYQQTITLTTTTDFQIPVATYLEQIETPIRAFLKNQQLTDEITCIVLTCGVPQMVSLGGGVSTASLLSAMNLPPRTALQFTPQANPYFQSSEAFAHSSPACKGMYLVTVLSGYHTADILALIDHGVAAEGTAPTGHFIFQLNPTVHPQVDALSRMLAINNFHAEVLTAPPVDRHGLMGYFSEGSFSGLSRDVVQGFSFLPGALVDIIQPFSAAPANFDEILDPVLLPISAFVQAGASGIHGMVGDTDRKTAPILCTPDTLLTKYTEGYSLAESFFSAMPTLNTGDIVLGDPLCSPYAQRPIITAEMDTGAVKGITPIRVSASSPALDTTISGIDLYLDNHFLTTVYEPGSTLVRLSIGEEVVSYNAPQGASLQTVLNELADKVNNDPILLGPDGVRAIPYAHTGTLALVSRNQGTEGNNVPIGIDLHAEGDTTPSILAHLDGGWLTGGGQDPSPASATISFVGRHLLAGDQIKLQIQQEHLNYTVPEHTSIADLPTALCALVNADQALQGDDGVLAIPAMQAMPFMRLQARSAGERSTEHGNAVHFQIEVVRQDTSSLHVYPETPSMLTGGHDGSEATQRIHLTLGEITAKCRYLLDTTHISEGFHRLRIVAYDGSLAQVQGCKDIDFTVANVADAPSIHLPLDLPPVNIEADIPVVADQTLAQVNLYIDGQLFGSSTTAPFKVHIPLSHLGRGAHDLQAEGVAVDGSRYLTSPVPLQVLTSPIISHVTPNFTTLAGGTVHRISGEGFLQNCVVRMAGIPARAVKYISPNLLEVVADAGVTRQGWVEVANPDGTISLPAASFEYYTPRVSSISVSPRVDVLAAGMKTTFRASCLDQHGSPIAANVNWEISPTAGNISPAGLFTAGKTPGSYHLRVSHPECKYPLEIPITIGPVSLPSDGQLSLWLVLGSFSDPDGTALSLAQIAEATVSPSHGDQEGELRWKTIFAENKYVDLFHNLTPNLNCTAYAHIYLHTALERKCELVYGSDDGIRLWGNGELLQSLHLRRAANPDDNTTPITLKSGWNSLLLKIDQGVGGWGFFMRIRSTDGKPLTGLRFSLDKPTL